MAAGKKLNDKIVLPEGSLDPRALDVIKENDIPPVVYGSNRPEYKYNWKYDPETDEWMAIPLDEGAVPIYVLPEKRKDK